MEFCLQKCKRAWISTSEATLGERAFLFVLACVWGNMEDVEWFQPEWYQISLQVCLKESRGDVED